MRYRRIVMIKPHRLHIGDKIAIVSLSSGILGEDFIKYELVIGVKRLEEFGLEPVFMPNALKGLDFLKNHPEARADDLKEAFARNDIKAIICAIGGDDTYRTLPYLLEDETFKNNVKKHPKIFIGYSDSTTNHLMLNKLGLRTFYGQALLTDLAEFEPNMLEYSKEAFERLFSNVAPYQIKPSPVWFEDRTDFSENAVGTLRNKHDDPKGYELLQGKGVVQGELLGGCLEILGYYIDAPVSDSVDKALCKKYNVFPTLDEWSEKIMFIETSEAKMQPEMYRTYIQKLKEVGVFEKINGLIVGKPIDEIFYDEYKQILKEELAEFDIPVLYNINVGHAYPHTIIPIGALAAIDCDKKTLTILESSVV